MIISLIIFLIISLVTIFLINCYVYNKTKNKIITNYKTSRDYDYIVVLGAKVMRYKPYPTIQKRIDKSIELYKDKVCNKILMTGEYTSRTYDEPYIMKKYAINRGVLEKDIIMDRLGISTFASIYRAKNSYKSKKIIIVTQKFHLFRALYIANKLGLEAYGIEAISIKSKHRIKREIREFFARVKDFFKCMIKN